MRGVLMGYDKMHNNLKPRKILLDSLCNFLTEIQTNRKPSSGPVRLIVHQYGYTPLYTPVYMALDDLMCAVSERCFGNIEDNISIKYKTAGTDKGAEDAVLYGNSLDIIKEAELHIGLSELISRNNKGEAVGFVEHPIIKRLPLWGVALSNNSKINCLKILRRQNKDYSEFPSKDSELLDYWQVFAGKLSLLQPHEGDLTRDFDGKPLSLSIYRKGSTVYRLFTKYLEDNHQIIKGEISYVGFDNEFDGLLKRDVDIALTVQPWRALSIAQKKFKNLELVYTHLGKPEPFTSLYIAINRDNESLLRSFLCLLGALVQLNVEDLYSNRKNIIDHAYESYEKALKVNNGITPHRMEGPEEFRYAMEVLNDSRIYFYDLFRGQSQETAAQIFSDRMHKDLAGSLDTVGKRDLIYTCSTYASKVCEIGYDWHSGVIIQSCVIDKPKIVDVIYGFTKIANELDTIFETNNSFNKTMDKWRFRQITHVLPELYDKCVKNGLDVPESPWHFSDSGDDFSPWIDLDKLRKAFEHLNAQFRDDLIIKIIKAGVGDIVKQGIMEMTSPCYTKGISWLWIEYDRKSKHSYKNAKFFLDPLAKRLLSCWYVNKKSNLCERMFIKSDDHGRLGIYDNNIVTHITYNDKEYHVTSEMIGGEGLFFTFLVEKVRYTKINGVQS